MNLSTCVGILSLKTVSSHAIVRAIGESLKVTKGKTTKPPLERRQRVQSAEMGMGILKALSRLGGAASLTLVDRKSVV